MRQRKGRATQRQTRLNQAPFFANCTTGFFPLTHHWVGLKDKKGKGGGCDVTPDVEDMASYQGGTRREIMTSRSETDDHVSMHER